MSTTANALRRPVDPRRYFEAASEARSDAAPTNPVCLYLETTNRCNLLCTTCPRAYEELKPPADMSWARCSGASSISCRASSAPYCMASVSR